MKHQPQGGYVVRFSRAQRDTNPGNADQLDRAGQTILRLLGKAAGLAEENSRHAAPEFDCFALG